MSNLFAKPFLTLLILFVCASASYAQAASANPSDACLAFKRGLSLGAPLTGIRAKLQSGKALTVVALGSSSTTGFGTGSGGAFPDVMKRELVRLRPSASAAFKTDLHTAEWSSSFPEARPLGARC